MKANLLAILFALTLVGCSGAGSADEQFRRIVEAGRVETWRSASLPKLDRALAVCALPAVATMTKAACSARFDEFLVILEARSSCNGWELPMCKRLEKLIETGPPALGERINRYQMDGGNDDFDWYRSPRNELLESLFGLDDRVALLQMAVRRHAVILGLMVLLFGVAWWLSVRYRLALEEVELKRVALRAELANIRMAERQAEAEAAQLQKQSRELEVEAERRRLDLERYRIDCEQARCRDEKRRRLSAERARVLRYFT